MSKLDGLIQCYATGRESKEDKFNNDEFFVSPLKISETVEAPNEIQGEYPLVFSGVRDEARPIQRQAPKSSGGFFGVVSLVVLAAVIIAAAKFFYPDAYDFTKQNIQASSNINFIAFFNGDFSSLNPPSNTNPKNTLGIFIPNIVADKMTPLSNGVRFEGMYKKYVCLGANGVVQEINYLKEIKIKLDDNRIILVKGIDSTAVLVNDRILETTILGDVTSTNALEVLTLN